MPAIYHEGEVISVSEVGFLGSDEAHYPQLTRLFLDFGFRVVSIASARQDRREQYLVTYRGSQDPYTTAVTPAFDTLSDLEAYTHDNVIDILQQTLFAPRDNEA